MLTSIYSEIVFVTNLAQMHNNPATAKKRCINLLLYFCFVIDLFLLLYQEQPKYFCQGIGLTLLHANSCLIHEAWHGSFIFLKSIICCFTFMAPVLGGVAFYLHRTVLKFKISLIVSISLSQQCLLSSSACCLPSNFLSL